MAKTKKNNPTPLISIIVPVWNVEKYIEETIRSIQHQTYDNWELLLVDDCSDDNGPDIIKAMQKTDKRIKLIRNKKNSGAAIARNNGITAARGDFICFLDSDDLWLPNKLEQQLNFANECHGAFMFAGYEYADEAGHPSGKKARVPKTMTYRQSLKNTVIFTSTVMFDMHKLAKETIYMPNIRRGQDMVTWWQILKTIDCAYGQNQVLALYRRHPKTLSSNKLRAARLNWHFYREIEKLSFIDTLFCFSCYCANAILRRL